MTKWNPFDKFFQSDRGQRADLPYDPNISPETAQIIAALKRGQKAQRPVMPPPKRGADQR